MVNRWVLSAYRVNLAEYGNQLTKSVAERRRRSNSQEDNLARKDKWAQTNISKYDINETQKIIEEMSRKDTSLDCIDKKVCNRYRRTKVILMILSTNRSQ